MNPFKTLFKHTFVYGLATVLPRMLSFLLVPLYTKLFSDSDYGIITIVPLYTKLFSDSDYGIHHNLIFISYFF
ncbi:hypothetical protein [Flavobacterium sp. CS20]|uniref:hypothetical protein n=1 Tax=Flavobacterium sp. CS20 TaxID=2775246 RepID=UPI0035303867